MKDHKEWELLRLDHVSTDNKSEKLIKGGLVPSNEAKEYTCRWTLAPKDALWMPNYCRLDSKDSCHWLDCKEDFLFKSWCQKDPTNTKWRLQRLDAENNPDLKAEICIRPCLAVSAISSLICWILGFQKMSRTPGWMENVFLLVVWLVLRLKSMKIIERFWVADVEKKRWKEMEEER